MANQRICCMKQLGTAYETLSDENRRTKYDATLASSQRTRQPPQPSDWPLQRQPDTNATTRAWRDDMQRRAWDWSRRAQERADQARREDDKFWTGPTYAHSNPRSGWGKERDREQKDWQDLYDQKQRQRAARKEACKEADRKKRDMNTPPPPPPGDQFDQGTEEFKARAGRYKKKQEAQEKAQRERREDDGYWGKPPSPQQPEPDWSDRVEKEYQETLEKEKRERADRRKAEKEKHEKEGPAELPFLLIEIIAIKVEIDKNEAKSHESKRQTTVRYFGVIHTCSRL